MWAAFFSLADFSLGAAEIAPAPSPDKSGYHLFNPTPKELLREMSTDRPDKTESAYTVDAGHVQVEMDLVNYSYDRYNADHTRNESLGIANANLKVGLCNDADFQLIVPTYNTARSKDPSTGKIQNQSGFGDLVTRLKMNLWGNDGGTTAFAAMPFLKFPTSQDDLGNHEFEGGIIFPLAIQLPRDWKMGAQTEFDFNKDESGRGHHAEFINSITFAHQIVGKLAGYAEFFSLVSAESGSRWIGTVDVGFVYALTENLQLDGGMNFGITRAADDFNPFVGITIRF
ncbi:MAG: transporter [Verrucomicrobiota bacterium]